MRTKADAHPEEVSSMRLTIRQPFDLASSLESGQAHRWRWLQDTVPVSAGVWHWGVIDGNLIRIRPLGDAQPSQPCGVEFSSTPHREPEYLESLLWRYFRLDEDIEAIYGEISRDPRVAAMVRQYRGLRLLRLEPWECLIAFICSANSNIPRIHANMEAISDSFGQRLTLDGHVRYTFPEPERLAEAGEARLRALGLGFRAPYVARAAVEVASGTLDLEALRRTPYQQAKTRLMELSGVGPKIADCVLLHSLDKLEAFPIDVWVRRALREWYFGGKTITDKLMWEWAQEYFGPHAGYAELYLFHGRRLRGYKKPANAPI